MMALTALRRRDKKAHVPAEWHDLQNASRPRRPPNTVIVVACGASSYEE